MRPAGLKELAWLNPSTNSARRKSSQRSGVVATDGTRWETKTSILLRFLDASATSRCLLVPLMWGVGPKETMAAELREDPIQRGGWVMGLFLRVNRLDFFVPKETRDRVRYCFIGGCHPRAESFIVRDATGPSAWLLLPRCKTSLIFLGAIAALICNYPSRLGHTVSRHNQAMLSWHRPAGRATVHGL
jgi:hypothetical protein